MNIQQLSKRAESPQIISVGQRPTKRHANTSPEPQRGVIKISPFQGLTATSLQSNRALPYPNDLGLSAHCTEFVKNINICNTKIKPNEYI